MRDFRLLDETALKPAVDPARRDADRERREQATSRKPERPAVQPAQDPVPPGGLGDHDRRRRAPRGRRSARPASGTVNIPGGKIAISGAFIPAFGLNNMPGAIPLLGGLFGGRDEGLFGITYRLFGPLDEPAAHDESDLGARAGIFARSSSTGDPFVARTARSEIRASRRRLSPWLLATHPSVQYAQISPARRARASSAQATA